MALHSNAYFSHVCTAQHMNRMPYHIPQCMETILLSNRSYDDGFSACELINYSSKLTNMLNYIQLDHHNMAHNNLDNMDYQSTNHSFSGTVLCDWLTEVVC